MKTSTSSAMYMPNSLILKFVLVGVESLYSSKGDFSNVYTDFIDSLLINEKFIHQKSDMSRDYLITKLSDQKLTSIFALKTRGFQ